MGILNQVEQKLQLYYAECPKGQRGRPMNVGKASKAEKAAPGSICQKEKKNGTGTIFYRTKGGNKPALPEKAGEPKERGRPKKDALQKEIPQEKVKEPPQDKQQEAPNIQKEIEDITIANNSLRTQINNMVAQRQAKIKKMGNAAMLNNTARLYLDKIIPKEHAIEIAEVQNKLKALGINMRQRQLNDLLWQMQQERKTVLQLWTLPVNQYPHDISTMIIKPDSKRYYMVQKQ